MSTLVTFGYLNQPSGSLSVPVQLLVGTAGQPYPLSSDPPNIPYIDASGESYFFPLAGASGGVTVRFLEENFPNMADLITVTLEARYFPSLVAGFAREAMQTPALGSIRVSTAEVMALMFAGGVKHSRR